MSIFFRIIVALIVATGSRGISCVEGSPDQKVAPRTPVRIAHQNNGSDGNLFTLFSSLSHSSAQKTLETEARCVELQAEKTALQNKLAVAEKSLESLQERVALNESFSDLVGAFMDRFPDDKDPAAVLERYQQQAQANAAELASVGGTARALESQIEALKERVKTQEQQLNGLDEQRIEREQLLSDKKALTGELSDVKASLAKAQASLSALPVGPERVQAAPTESSDVQKPASPDAHMKKKRILQVGGAFTLAVFVAGIIEHGVVTFLNERYPDAPRRLSVITKIYNEITAYRIVRIS